MLDGIKNSAPRAMDPLGRLLFRGQEIASYLFQVPDDAAQWERIRNVAGAIVDEASKSTRRELPQIAREIQELLDQPPSVMLADQLVACFDRMVKLWKAAKSGLMDASRLSQISMQQPTETRPTRNRGEPALWD